MARSKFQPMLASACWSALFTKKLRSLLREFASSRSLTKFHIR
jgi:hypothetical protein